ncbi:MAG: putative transrane protein [Sphingomonas bacterium]|uniref:HPP family protein n=1 Tax=Sphingomonas bacterium TaxID=1895847 RepID=UPI0026211A74|nr:HPP family protein [Sphingomonas bacterium]MDB5705170.1 putative transrane protein [Sphingomonas bacterium]
MSQGRSFPRLFVPLLAGASLRDRVIGCIGALLGIALTAFVCTRLPQSSAALPFLAAPIGASAVLVFAVPASPLAQPWAVFGGNIVSAMAGVTTAHLFGHSALVAGIAVAGAILAMSLLRCLHPPGGAVALTAVIGGPAILNAGYLFAFMPVAINSFLLVAIGLIFHRFSGHSYPHRATMTQGVEPAREPGFHPEAIDLALADLGETFDVSREDLDLLLQRAAFHEGRRVH